MPEITKEEQIANIKRGLAFNTIPPELRQMMVKKLAELENND